jgi:hypothetical protein
MIEFIDFVKLTGMDRREAGWRLSWMPTACSVDALGFCPADGRSDSRRWEAFWARG